MDVNYRNYKPGNALAANIVLSLCPVCDASCHEKRTKKAVRYVHQVRIERAVSEETGRAWMKVVVTQKCEIKAAERETVELCAEERRKQGQAPQQQTGA